MLFEIELEVIRLSPPHLDRGFRAFVVFRGNDDPGGLFGITVRPAADAKEISLIPEFDAQAGPVYGDPSRLQQVVWNLLSNAIKFTPKGGSVRMCVSRVDDKVIGQPSIGANHGRDLMYLIGGIFFLGHGHVGAQDQEYQGF